MKTISKYWNLARLNSAGQIQTTEISQAKQLMMQQFANLIESESINDKLVQQELVAVRNSRGKQSIIADRCLRCFISHQIVQTCIQLELQFGQEHGFNRYDLFIYCLNDTLDNFRNLDANQAATHIATKNQYKSLAVELLETFDPQKANLTTWTTRYVKQNKELQRFLLEQGVYLISNWAILNDTSNKQVRRILSEFHHLTPREIQQFYILLTCYHHVYRGDRLKNRQTRGGKCPTPSTEQLKRIADLLEQQADLSYTPEHTLFQLEQLANRLREYRIHVRGGKIKQESLDNSNLNTEAMQADLASSQEEHPESSDFLKSYQQQFQQSLDHSIETVVNQRLSKFKGKKAGKKTQFITALELFHCRGESMSAIAPQVQLKAQYQVTRLLKLKELRADIRQNLLQLMQDWTTAKLANLADLKQREQAIELALAEQIDQVLDEAEKEVSIADSSQSLLAKRICAYLDRLLISNE
ncbi:MAG: hypothetical protein AAFQ80_16430 [Cyanobacteria bacterium J06621_8]